MTMRWTIAALHLIALAIGFAGILGRASALRTELDDVGLKRVFAADSLWGLAALLWISTGLARALGGFEKPATYYMHSDAFILKMVLLLVILLLEVWPMTTLIRWRVRSRKHMPIDTSPAAGLALSSTVQAALVIGMVLAATAVARGLGYEIF